MPVNVHTEWSRLREVIVGRGLSSHPQNVDLSFRLFYHQNIKHSLLQNSVFLQQRLIDQREEDLDNLADYLSKNGVKVLRPDRLPEVSEVKVPNFATSLHPMDNPRDLVLAVGDHIIETPVVTRHRYFETDLLKKVLYGYFKDGAKWICAPRPMMKDSSFDYSFVQRDPGNQDWSAFRNRPDEFEMMFDAAQCLKFGRHLLMNVSTENHRLGATWLQNVLGNKFEILTVNLTDHHIDGMLMPLRPGKLLLSPAMKGKTHLLPERLQKWDFLEFDEPEKSEYDSSTVLLASSNISVNVLSLDPENVLVFSPTGEPPSSLVSVLERHGFNAHVLRFRHSKVFDGGLHCATLDMVREDHCENYLD